MMTPDFLIVGAMKAGTTTLYRDLQRHPSIFLPSVKEPEVLIHSRTIEKARAHYAELFRRARDGQVRGEASTAYTKRPTYEGVPERARAVCGAVKVIYLRRDPLERIISHYNHELQRGLISAPFEDVILSDSRFIDYSRYDWQISPWIEEFGLESIIQIELSEYSANRIGFLRRIASHIGVDPDQFGRIDTSAIENAAAEPKSTKNRFLNAIAASHLYQYRIKRYVPSSVRKRFRYMAFPKVNLPHVEVSDHILSYICAQLSSSESSRGQSGSVGAPRHA